MRKKMMLLVLSFAMLAGALATAPVQADDGYYCPRCTTFSDGSQCCIPCWCYPDGWTACHDIGCGEV